MMTIEEKAKAYDEAVKRAKSQIAAGLINQDVCEYILPGLVETEDKKIAESLIKTLKDRISLGVVSNGYSREDYIEWLEKYLETNSEKPKKWLKEDYDYYDTIVRKLEVIGEDSGLTRNQIQFLSEHNPCDFEVEIEKAHKNADEVQYRKGFKDGVDSVKSSEWTEEDDVMAEDIIDAIPTNYAASDYKEMVSWLRFKLKSLKPQPKGMLSDEDEKIIDAIVWFLEQTKYTNHNLVWKSDAIGWLRLKLKYLRPAPQIKSVDYENI